jgi:hypothetical protein
MSKNKHVIEQEELMAYLDGELATDRAIAAAAHLEHCQECQELAAELRKVSAQMMEWQVEAPDSAGMPGELAIALEKPRKQEERRLEWRLWGVRMTPKRALTWAAVTSVCVLLGWAFFAPNYLRSRPSAYSLRMAQKEETYIPGNGNRPQQKTDAIYGFIAPSAIPKSGPNDIGTAGKLLKQHEEGPGYQDTENTEGEQALPSAPMIARTAGLALVAKDFDRTRAGVEAILQSHHGYIGEMNVSGSSGSGRTLTATLRIPAQQLDSALAELKKLGRVENESQGGEEVTAHYVDLEARLKNAQHTEQRLTEILSQRTGKLQDVLKVELEIDRVRGEIEQMQAEKKELSRRVAFATLNTTVKEEYQARLEGAPPSTSSRFHNAAVEGYNTLVDGLIEIGLFLLSAGPSLLVWAVVLFFPVRWGWRKLRAEPKKSN